MIVDFAFPVKQRTTRGFTLIELMVALVIISLLAGIALPSVKKMIEGQRLSRAASTVQAVIQESQARSMSRGGGSGILIERLGVASLYERVQATTIRLVDSPPAYGGEGGVPKPIIGVDGATGVISLWFHPASSQMVRSAQDIFDDPIGSTLINIGDIVHIEGAGIALTITGIQLGTISSRNTADLSNVEIPDADITNWVQVRLKSSEVNIDFSRFLAKRAAFSIVRSPRRAIAMPAELPTGAAIDLSASGLGRYGNEFSPMEIQGNYLDDSLAPFGAGPFNYQSIMILFGSRGEVSRVLGGSWNGATVVLNDIPVTGDIHLLVGEAGQVKVFPSEQLEDQDSDPLADEADDGTTPLLNLESIWVTIKVRSGEVIASPLIDPTDQDTSLTPNSVGLTDTARRNQIRAVIGLTRSGAIESQDTGSL